MTPECISVFSTVNSASRRGLRSPLVPDPTARNARASAQARLSEGLEARVLEPSPPFAQSDPDYLADDPVAIGAAAAGTTIVSPTAVSQISWDDLAADDPELAEFTADRWLGAWRRLPDLPGDWHEARLALHRLAAYVLSPARMEAIGKMGLRFTQGGFGTPFFGSEDRQARLEGVHVVVQTGEEDVAFEPVTTLAVAADLVGAPLDATVSECFDAPEMGDPDEPLAVTPVAAGFTGDWFGFAWSVLEQIRAETPELHPSRLQLWPEHFDAAFDQGDEAAGRRAGYGCSPGDHHPDGDPEPYVYLSLWAKDDVPDDPFWNAPFGAKLPWSELSAADDHREAALQFFRQGRALLTP